MRLHVLSDLHMEFSAFKLPMDLASGKGHVVTLSSALAKFGASARSAIDAAARFGDADTADLFTGVSRGVDKLLWMVEAHTQAKE